MTREIDAEIDAELELDEDEVLPVENSDVDLLADALDTLFAVQRDFFADVAARLDLLEIDVRAMLYVYQRERVSPKALARHLRLTGGGATTVVDRLQNRGFLARTPNPHDRRSLYVVPTTSGSRAARAIRRAFGAEIAWSVQDSCDRQRIAIMVRRLNKRIGASTDVSRNHPGDS